MAGKIPWFAARRKFAAQALFDLIVFILAYFICFYISYGILATASRLLAVTATSWVLISYLAGRYTPSSWQDSLSPYKQTFLTCLTVLAEVTVFSWIFNDSTYFMTRPSFFLPYISIASLSCLSFHIINHHRVINGVKNLIFLCTEDECTIINSELDQSRRECHLQSRTIFVHDPNEFIGLVCNSSDCDVNNEADYIISDSFLESGFLERILFDKHIPSKAQIWSLSHWCELNLERIPPEFVSQTSEFFFTAIKPSSSSSWRLKRAVDLFGSLLLLVVLTLPLFLALICVAVSDGFPLFYKQTRTGYRLAQFDILKIRTMRTDSESQGPRWSSVNDSRVTNIGRILRKYRIDEIPQVWNIISGDMSLVGPRPERYVFESILSKKIPHYFLRYTQRPGLTGWAQVQYPYGASLSDSRMKTSFDFYYIKNKSLLLDLYILMGTFKLVIFGRGSSPRDHLRRS
jgi:lipopolysaccharide/colanic/teichoic acid biosynthesis glycosyltransferase